MGGEADSLTPRQSESQPPRKFSFRYEECVKEITVWLGTPAADIEHAVRRLFAMPLTSSYDALLFTGPDGSPCAVSSHAPSGTLFHVSCVQSAVARSSPRSNSVAPGKESSLERSTGLELDAGDLQWDRFRTMDRVLPAHLDRSHAFCGQRAKDCRETGKMFIDTEPASLTVPPTPRPQQISSCMRSDNETQELEEELNRTEEDRERRNKAVCEILAKVQVWRRPSQYADMPTVFPTPETANTLNLIRPPGLPVPVSGLPPPHMPMFSAKGVFGDVFFTLAVSIVACNNRQLANNFVSCEHGDCGLYTFQFCTDKPTFGVEEWRCVTVDDSIPCGKDLRPVLAATESKEELWSVLLHKAYAKFLGSYSHLHVGDTPRALYNLTGCLPEVVEWEAGKCDEDALSILWWRLQEITRLGLTTSAMRRSSECPLVSDVYTSTNRRSTSRGNMSQGPINSLRRSPPWRKLNWDNGVLVCFAVQAQVGPRPQDFERLVKIRDPYAEISWTGDWSDQSNQWTKELRELLAHKVVDEHIAWMRLSDFACQFDTLLLQTRYQLIGADNIPPPVCFFDRIMACEAKSELRLFAHQFSVKVEASSEQTLMIHLSQPEFTRTTGYVPARAVPLELGVWRTDQDGLLKLDTQAEGEEVMDEEPGFHTSYEKLTLCPAEEISSTSPRSRSPLMAGPKGEYLERGTVALKPGQYVVTVHQQEYKDAANFCLYLGLEKPEAGVVFTVRELGTIDSPMEKRNFDIMTPDQMLIRTNPASRVSVAQYL